MITFIFRFMTKENCALYSAYFSVIYKMVLVSKSASRQILLQLQKKKTYNVKAMMKY